MAEAYRPHHHHPQSRTAPVSPAYARRKATVVLLTLTLVLLACVQGMIVVFAHKDRARLAQIRDLTRRISEERAAEERAERAFEGEDAMRIHRSAPARGDSARIEAPPLAVPGARQPLGRDIGISPVGSPREGLGHLVELANYMAKENRASLVEWRGRLAILYQKIDPAAADPFWEILNVVTEMKLLETVTVLASEGEAAKAGEVRKALLDFGIEPDRLKLGRKAEDAQVFSGLLISTLADP